MNPTLIKSNAVDTTRSPTEAIWADFPIDEIEGYGGLRVGYGFTDDFVKQCPNTDAGLFEDAGESAGMGYLFFADTGVLHKAQPGATEGNGVGGVLEVSVNDSDNDESVMSTASPSFLITDTNAFKSKLAFECRCKKASIADDALAMFMGLGWDHGAGVSVAKNDCLTDTDGALGAFSFVGFHVDHANGDAIDFVVKAEGQAQTVIAAGILVPEADTYFKLGFVFDPNASVSERIAIWVNGVRQGTFVTATQIAAATFPDGEAMAAVMAEKVGESAEVKSQKDWWRCYQLLC